MPADDWRAATDKKDFDYVYAGRRVPFEQEKPVLKPPAQEAAFVGVDHAPRGAGCRAGGTFHFACHQCVAMAAYKVKLAPAPRFEIAAQHFCPVCAEE